MLLTNYRITNAGQSRQVGGQLNPTQNLDPARWSTFYVGGNNVTNVTNKTSQPASGYRPPYGLLIAPKPGGMSMQNSGTGTISNAAQVAGMAAIASLSGVGVISNAAAGLTVQLVAALTGSGTLTASIIGNLQALASLNGSGTLTGAASALAGLVATVAGTGIVSSASATALGQMVADIFVNQSQATVQEIVDAVWNALASEYNISGTMGNKLNGAGSAGDPWTTDISAYNTANTAGKILKDRLSKGQFIALK